MALLYFCAVWVALLTATTSIPALAIPYYIGFYATPSEFARMDGLLDRKMDHEIAYVNRYGWAYYTDVGGAFDLPGKISRGHKLAISIPTILDAEHGTDMHSAATGAYNSYYQELAQKLAPYKANIIAFTINWEFNGFWLYHGVTNSDFTLRWSPDDFIGAHRRLTDILRQYLPGIPIVWCLNNGPDLNLPAGYKAADFYPGDAYVDVIGINIYEQHWGSFAGARLKGGLDYVDAFASAHGKKIAFPEWSAANNDGSFITQMAAWFNARGGRILFHTYWNSTDGGVPTGGLNVSPAQQEAYIDAYKGTRYDGAALAQPPTPLGEKATP